MRASKVTRDTIQCGANGWGTQILVDFYKAIAIVLVEEYQKSGSHADCRSAAKNPKITKRTCGMWVTGFALFAYLIGWLSASAYYKALGASWMVDILSPVSIAAWSWTPLAGLAYFCYLEIIDVSDAGEARLLKAHAVVRRWWAPLLLMIIAPIAGHLFGKTAQLVLTSIALLLFCLLAVSIFSTIVGLVKSGGFIWDRFDARLVYFLILIGFYWLPTQMGSLKAEIVMLGKGDLPRVLLHQQCEGNLRLLYANESNAYIAELPSDGTVPLIRVVPYSEVKGITSRIEKKVTTSSPANP